jgi:hypothetical protein
MSLKYFSNGNLRVYPCPRRIWMAPLRTLSAISVEIILHMDEAIVERLKGGRKYEFTWER